MKQVLVSDPLIEQYVHETFAIEGVLSVAELPWSRHYRLAHMIKLHGHHRRFHPQDMHRYAFSGYDEFTPGMYRTEAMSIYAADEESVHLPESEQVPALMQQWEQLYQNMWFVGDQYPVHDQETLCWILHHHFLCIHPFRDGNGRIARLVLNHIRIRLGLPFLVLRAVDKGWYYEMIRQYELNVFPEFHSASN